MEETKKALNQVDDFSGPLIGTYKPFEIIDNIYCRACYDWNGGIGEPNTGGCCQHSQPDKCKNPILYLQVDFNEVELRMSWIYMGAKLD